MTYAPENEPFHKALRHLGDKTAVASRLSSQEWRDKVAVGLRDRAFFSARIENARVLQTIQDYISDFLQKTIDPAHGGLKAQGRAEFVADMRELCQREGIGKLDPATGKISPEIDDADITDIRSISRLQLIFDVQTEQAYEYGYWSQGNDPDILSAYPAQRFIRVRPVKVPRPYHAAAEGSVRRKDDLDFWLSMNPDFGVPYGPWGFNSGMGVEDVGRREAQALGLIEPGEKIAPPDRDLNTRLSASVRDFSHEIMQELRDVFGEQIKIEGGKAWWTGIVSEPVKPEPPAQKTASTTPQEALAIAGIDSGKDITLDQARALIEELKESQPTEVSKIEKITGSQKSGTLTKKFIQDTYKEFIGFLPKGIVEQLPVFQVSVNSAKNNKGSFDKSKKKLTLSKQLLLSEAAAKKTLFHELLHWVHENDPQVRGRVQQLWDKRTTGNNHEGLNPYGKGIRGNRDHWKDVDGDEYAGRVYPWEGAKPKGTEVLTRHLEKLSSPELLVRNWNFTSEDGNTHWRDAFIELIKNLYE